MTSTPLHHMVQITTKQYPDCLYVPCTSPHQNGPKAQWVQATLDLTIPTHLIQFDCSANDYRFVRTTEGHVHLIKYLMQSAIHTHLHSLLVSYITANPQLSIALFYLARGDKTIGELRDQESKGGDDHQRKPAPQTHPPPSSSSVPIHSSFPVPQSRYLHSTTQLWRTFLKNTATPTLLHFLSQLFSQHFHDLDPAVEKFVRKLTELKRGGVSIPMRRLLIDNPHAYGFAPMTCSIGVLRGGQTRGGLAGQHHASPPHNLASVPFSGSVLDNIEISLDNIAVVMAHEENEKDDDDGDEEEEVIHAAPWVDRSENPQISTSSGQCQPFELFSELVASTAKKRNPIKGFGRSNPIELVSSSSEDDTLDSNTSKVGYTGVQDHPTRPSALQQQQSTPLLFPKLIHSITLPQLSPLTNGRTSPSASHPQHLPQQAQVCFEYLYHPLDIGHKVQSAVGAQYCRSPNDRDVIRRVQIIPDLILASSCTANPAPQQHYPPTDHQIYVTEYPVPFAMAIVAPPPIHKIKIAPDYLTFVQAVLKRTNEAARNGETGPSGSAWSLPTVTTAPQWRAHHPPAATVGQTSSSSAMEASMLEIQQPSLAANISRGAPGNTIFGFESHQQNLDQEGSNPADSTLKGAIRNHGVIQQLFISDPVVIIMVCYWSQLLAVLSTGAGFGV